MGKCDRLFFSWVSKLCLTVDAKIIILMQLLMFIEEIFKTNYKWRRVKEHKWRYGFCTSLNWWNVTSRLWYVLYVQYLEQPLKSYVKGLPWWCSGWESACQCRGLGFEPWSGKIPQAAEQLGPWATTTEPALLEPVLHNKRGRDSERPAHRDEEWPPLAATGESPRTETKTQHNQK